MANVGRPKGDEGVEWRFLVSPIIESWKERNRQRTITVLSDLVFGLAEGSSLVLDVVSGGNMNNVNSYKEFLGPPLLTRSYRPPGTGLVRFFGLDRIVEKYSVVFNVRDPAKLMKAFAQGDKIWLDDFLIYSTSSGELDFLGDPHSGGEALYSFASKVRWFLCQETGSECWLLTSSEIGCLDSLLVVAKRIFEGHAAELQIKQEVALFRNFGARG